MNPQLQLIREFIDNETHLSSEEKGLLKNACKGVEKQMEILRFKLDRTEKVKNTTAILLEETIAELETKRQDVEKVNTALKESIENLKATQAQLIHSEKMASLGELTAGIAHEIQNPLNFVNNFAQVSIELLDEMKDEIPKPHFDQVGDLHTDLKTNLEKINDHGQRASGIVKAMLDHSRASSGNRELTDINKLCDEYLRLAYHGMRAKDKSFNVTLTTSFDDNVGTIAIIPQDIGRVLLNLITNAFYAVNKKRLSEKTGFTPTVSVSTKLLDKNPEGLSSNIDQIDRSIYIEILDNGTGIPVEIQDKIFQPFFTTKPTGQGTGLGLSLAYDIIRVHDGDLSVESSASKGTKFSIRLPARQD